MDAEALPQRSAGARRSRTQDTRPRKIAKDTGNDDRQERHSNPTTEALAEYRSSAEQDQQFECEVAVYTRVAY